MGDEAHHAWGMTLYADSIYRNKRCLLAYLGYRFDKIIEAIWHKGSGEHFTQEQKNALSPHEVEFGLAYEKALAKYMYNMRLNLQVDLEPPKALSVQVRVLEDCGELLTRDSGVVDFSAGRELFLRRTDADRLVRAGKLQVLGYS